MDEIDNMYYELDELDEMRKLFSDRNTTSIRIAVNPEKMVIKEAQRSFTYLNIYDFNMDGGADEKLDLGEVIFCVYIIGRK